jgi:hypothetical protein
MHHLTKIRWFFCTDAEGLVLKAQILIGLQEIINCTTFILLSEYVAKYLE